MEIIKATAEHFDSVYPLIRQMPGSVQDKNIWQNLFKRFWPSNEDNFGYILLDEDKVVGYLGLVHSERIIRGEKHRIANLTSWYVEPSHRGRSISLLAPVMRDENLTVTCFTPSPQSEPIFRKFGMTVVDEYFKLIVPLPIITFDHDTIRIVNNEKDIFDLISADEKKILDHHRELKSIYFLIQHNNKYCLVVGQKVKKRGLPFIVLHYINEPQIFAKGIPYFLPGLCWKTKSLGALIFEHYIDGVTIWPTFKIKMKHPTMLKSKMLTKRDIDTLYSEYFLLNFA